MASGDAAVSAYIILCILLGFVISIVYFFLVKAYNKERADEDENTHLTANTASPANVEEIFTLSESLQEGGYTFMSEKYSWLAHSMIVALPLMFFMSIPSKANFTPSSEMPSFDLDWGSAVLSTFSFVMGAISSIVAGRVAMRIGGLANAGVTVKAYKNTTEAFYMAIKGGMVMGFILITVGILNLFALTGISYLVYQSCDYYNDCKLNQMYGAVAGYGLGASFVAMFSRVGGGIYTKASDVASDLVDVIDYKTIQKVSKELQSSSEVKDRREGQQFKDFAVKLEIKANRLEAQEKIHESFLLKERNRRDEAVLIDKVVFDLCLSIKLLEQSDILDQTAFVAENMTTLETEAEELKDQLEEDERRGIGWEPKEKEKKYLDLQINLDNKKHPSGIADLVGENVCDIGGMGADLFASFVEGTCAAMVILSCASNCVYWDTNSATGMVAMAGNFPAMMFPLAISATGLAVCFATMVLCTSCKITSAATDTDPESHELNLIDICVARLKVMLLGSAGFMTPCFFILASCLLPDSFWIAARIGHRYSDNGNVGPNKAVCESVVWDKASGTAIAFGEMTKLTQSIFEGSDSSSRCLGMPGTTSQEVQWWGPPLCASVGLWAAIIVGYTAEYYTSNRSAPVREIAEATSFGDAVTLIYGLALGYQSVVPFMWTITITVFISWTVAQMFGIACAALGMTSIVVTWIALSGYCPIAHNAAGITRMCHMWSTKPDVFHRVQALNSAGNTIAAMGKAYSVVSAAMVSLALFGGFCARADVRQANVSLLEPMVFLGLFVGAMIPFYFSAMVLRSVVDAAEGMVNNVKEDVKQELRDLLKRDAQDLEDKKEATLDLFESDLIERDGKKISKRTEYIQTGAHDSLKELVWFNHHLGCPGISPLMLVVCTPILMGLLFGKLAMGGVVMGTIVSGVTMALAACNTGHALDNVHTYVQQGYFQARDDGMNVNLGIDTSNDDQWNRKLKESLQKDTEAHDASRVGNTVGDPLKDAAGPGINIVMKLVAMVALCVAPMVANIRMGYGAIGCTMNVNCAA